MMTSERFWRRVPAGVLSVLALLLAFGAVSFATAMTAEEEETHSDPVRQGPELVVDTISTDNVTWSLHAYRSDQGLCVELHRRLAGRDSTAGECGNTAKAVSVSTLSDGETGSTLVFGTTRSDTGAVKIRLSDGRTMSAPTRSAVSAGIARRFFLARFSGSAEVVDAVVNADG